MKYNHRATSFDFFYKREISKKQKWFLTNIQFFELTIRPNLEGRIVRKPEGRIFDHKAES